MADLIFVGVIVAFFAVASAFVIACDRIIGPDELVDSVGVQPSDRVSA